ncbi:DedA family protein [Arthrobacter sp. NicSoilC12]|uniref:DedA family protein n=1 Tax=Arthrobacter sp. NicSoilC12 TaxID=2831001 RepID=UPI001CC68919|nr:DedA family protein [Arthrobacter sp. NicSoilC12]GIU56468.1 hypothetical protein NicSoilC12_22170 [Arthrobacter sp. NicSoilC12]
MTGLVAFRFVALGWAVYIAAEAGGADEWAYYFSVFVIVLAQCAGVPLPAVAVLLGAYASARHGDLNLTAVIAVGSLGAMLGSTIGYVLGRVGGRPLMLRLAQRFHADENRILQLESFFDRHGGKALFFGRWVIVVRLWGAIAAGAAKMPWPNFLLWTITGSIAWVASLSVLAYLAGALANAIGDALDIGGWVLVPFVVLGLVIVWRRRRRRKLRSAGGAGGRSARCRMRPFGRVRPVCSCSNAGPTFKAEHTTSYGRSSANGHQGRLLARLGGSRPCTGPALGWRPGAAGRWPGLRGRGPGPGPGSRS